MDISCQALGIQMYQTKNLILFVMKVVEHYNKNQMV